MSDALTTGAPSGWDAVVVATEAAAAALREVGGEIGERRDQQPAMRTALSGAAGWRVDASETTLPLLGWCHPPRGIDIGATDPAGSRWIGELKLRATDQILWDLLKLADGVRLRTVTAAFLQVGAVDTALDRADMCVELLQRGAVEHDTLSLFNANRLAWSELLQGGTARPIDLPAAIRTTLLAAPKIRLDDSAARLLLIAVEPDRSQSVGINRDWWCGDWPPGVEPHPRYVVWRRRHCRFLRALDAAGPLDVDRAQALSREHQLDLKRDCALTHACLPLVSPKPTRTVTAAGRAFVEQWAEKLGG
jgi:hypothetical protein